MNNLIEINRSWHLNAATFFIDLMASETVLLNDNKRQHPANG